MPEQTRLVLTRRVHQRICIGEDVMVEVVGVSNGNIRLCVTAPTDVLVDREEIRIRRRKADAAPVSCFPLRPLFNR